MGKIRVRKAVTIIPGLLRANVSRSGLSFTAHLGKLWSYNTRRRTHRLNLLGPVSWESDTPTQRRRRRRS